MSGIEVKTAEKYLCIMPTFQCTAECTHCGTVSSPRDHTWLPDDLMNDAIDEAAAAGFRGIVFTGGEPTLAGDKLFMAMRRAGLHGLPLRVVTNGHWAASDESAARWIENLVSAGLSEINLSTGDQHSRFVPLDNIFHAARTSVAACVATVIMVECVRERTVSKKAIESDERFQAILHDHPHAQLTVLESVWSPLSPSRIQGYPTNVAVDKTNLAQRRGCESIFLAPTVQPDGRISPCCGLGIRFVPELQIGNIGEVTILEATQKAEGDFLKQWIRLEGPEKILAWAATIDPSIEWENMYAHHCQACIRLYRDQKVRKVIAERGAARFGELVEAGVL